MKLLEKASPLGMLATLAQVPGPEPITPVTGISTFGQLFIRVVTWILLIAGAIAVIFLIYGGIQYLTAGGNPEQATKAKTTIVNAVIGIIVIALAFAIFFVVRNFVLGIQ